MHQAYEFMAKADQCAGRPFACSLTSLDYLPAFSPQCVNGNALSLIKTARIRLIVSAAIIVESGDGLVKQSVTPNRADRYAALVELDAHKAADFLACGRSRFAVCHAPGAHQ